MSGHAVLSPSAASRWLSCPPSARLELTFPESSSEASKEGTLAHALGELMLSDKLGLVGKAEYKRKLAEIQKSKYYSKEFHLYVENYTIFVLEKFSEAQAHTPDALIFLEQKLDLTAFIPEGFGTGDAIIIANRVLKIIDLKFGKGVLVNAEHNKQMMIYGLGALEAFDYLYDIDTVEMHIYQPRIDNFSTFEMQAGELREWAAQELMYKAKLAFAGEGDFSAGDHCRFCKARAVCRVNAETNLEIAKHDFKKPDLLTDEEIADIISRGSLFTKWLKAVGDHALSEAVKSGKKWPGYKLVEGRSNRAYENETLVNQALLLAGYAEQDFTVKKLLPITKMEAELGKAEFAKHLGPYVIKPPGAPTLAPLSDKRPEYDRTKAAQFDFGEADTED